MPISRKIFFLTLLILPLFVGISPADADIYRYVDENGKVHFTDTPTHGRWNMYLKETPTVNAGHRSYLDIIRRHAISYQLE